MRAYPDYRDLIDLFNAHKVEFIIVGGHAIPYQGTPDYNKDVDILVKPDSINAIRILKAFDAFAFHSADLTTADFDKPKQVVKFGRPPHRFDILTSLADVPWEEAFSGRESGKFGDIPVHYIGHQQYIASKKAIKRQKKLADKVFEVYCYFTWKWRYFIRFVFLAEKIIRWFFGIKPRNPFVDVTPYLDKAIDRMIKECAKNPGKYGGEIRCLVTVHCDFAYASDICRLESGYDCSECPSRKARREKMKQDIANDPRL
jgi:hypothetical protein